MTTTQPTKTLLVQEKSIGISIMLAILFGPVGMFYATVNGAFIMLAITFLGALFTLGLSLFITWPICVIWAGLSAEAYNTALKIELARQNTPAE